MKPWRWFDRYQTGREDFVRIHRQVIRVGFWGAASVFFALRSLMVPDGTLIDSAVVAHLLLFAPLFVWSSIRPSLMPVLILFLAVLLLYVTGSQSQTLRRLLLDYGHPTAYLPLLGAYAAHLWYMAVHPFLFVRPRDFATYGVGYLGGGLQPRDTGYASTEEEEADEDEDEGFGWTDKLNKEYWTVHDPTFGIWGDLDH